MKNKTFAISSNIRKVFPTSLCKLIANKCLRQSIKNESFLQLKQKVLVDFFLYSFFFHKIV
jgi:hypothetical protein